MTPRATIATMASTVSSTTNASEKEELTTANPEEELMRRLQSQFGDMDLTNLLPTSQSDQGSLSEESSLADPSPEELQAWQEAQFQKGQAQVLAKKKASKSAVQRRRDHLGEESWERVPAAPNLQDQRSVFFPTTSHCGNVLVGVHPLLQQLGQADDILGTTWRSLYSSSLGGDGLSFANLSAKVEGYPGPTVLLVGAVPSKSKSLTRTTSSTAATTTIGFFTTASWSTGADSSDCFLFAFDDAEEKVHFFRPSEPHNSQQYMHCQSTTHQPGSHPPPGLYVGGSSSQPRLHLTESLEECRALDFCRAFQAGDLLLGHAQDSLNYFDVVHLEVWAVGGDEWIQSSLEVQRNHRSLQETNRLKAQRVDKAAFLNDFQTGFLSANRTQSGLFAHHGYNRERCDMSER